MTRFAFFALPALCVCVEVMFYPTDDNIVIEGATAEYQSSIKMDEGSIISQIHWIVNDVVSSSPLWKNMTEQGIEIVPGTAGENNSTLTIPGNVKWNNTIVERSVIELIGVTPKYHTRSGRLLIQDKPGVVGGLHCSFSLTPQASLRCNWITPHTLKDNIISYYNVNITVNKTTSIQTTTEENEYEHIATEGGIHNISVAAVIAKDLIILEGEINTFTTNLPKPDDSAVSTILTSALLTETTSGAQSTIGTSSGISATSGTRRVESTNTLTSSGSTVTLSADFWAIIAFSVAIIVVLLVVILVTSLLLARQNKRKKIMHQSVL